jgi:predicted transcriptional regulator
VTTRIPESAMTPNVINFTLTELEVRVAEAVRTCSGEWSMGKEIAALLGISASSINRKFKDLVGKGVLRKVSRGIYRLEETT